MSQGTRLHKCDPTEKNKQFDAFFDSALVQSNKTYFLMVKAVAKTKIFSRLTTILLSKTTVLIRDAYERSLS